MKIKLLIICLLTLLLITSCYTQHRCLVTEKVYIQRVGTSKYHLIVQYSGGETELNVTESYFHSVSEGDSITVSF